MSLEIKKKRPPVGVIKSKYFEIFTLDAFLTIFKKQMQSPTGVL